MLTVSKVRVTLKGKQAVKAVFTTTGEYFTFRYGSWMTPGSILHLDSAGKPVRGDIRRGEDADGPIFTEGVALWPI